VIVNLKQLERIFGRIAEVQGNSSHCGGAITLPCDAKWLSKILLVNFLFTNDLRDSNAAFQYYEVYSYGKVLIPEESIIYDCDHSSLNTNTTQHSPTCKSSLFSTSNLFFIQIYRKSFYSKVLSVIFLTTIIEMEQYLSNLQQRDKREQANKSIIEGCKFVLLIISSFHNLIE
jgi:hypothetical protein